MLGVIFLSSCTLVPRISDAPVRIQVNPTLPNKEQGTSVTKQMQLAIATPRAPRDLYTDGIICIFNDREVASLMGYRWVTTIPDLLQHALVNGLDANGAFASVSYEATGLASQATVQADIKQFALFYKAEKTIPKVIVDITLRMVNVSTGKALSSLPVHIETLAKGQKPEDLASAFDEAVSEMLAQVSSWSIEALKNQKQLLQ